MLQRITSILLFSSIRKSIIGKSAYMAFLGLYLFNLSFDSFAQRSYSPLAPSYAQAAVIPYSQDVFVSQSEDSLDLTFAKKRVLKAKNGVDFHLRSFFSKADYRDQLFKFFPGKRKQMDASLTKGRFLYEISY